jgi:hypothetical protein
MILGMNGSIWLSEHDGTEHGDMKDIESKQAKLVSQAGHERIARVRNCILALAKQFLPIYDQTVMDVFYQSLQMDIATHEILNSEYLVLVTQTAMERRQTME